MLPTNEKAIGSEMCIGKRIIPSLYPKDRQLFYGFNLSTFIFQRQHLYICLDNKDYQISDKVIRNDYYNPMSIHTLLDELEVIYADAENVLRTHREDLRIVASTDKSLGLPGLSQGFIKKYCELGGINEVMVEFLTINENGIDHAYCNTKDEIKISKIKDTWSKQEVIELIKDFHYQCLTKDFDMNEKENWIQENID